MGNQHHQVKSGGERCPNKPSGAFHHDALGFFHRLYSAIWAGLGIPPWSYDVYESRARPTTSRTTRDNTTKLNEKVALHSQSATGPHQNRQRSKVSVVSNVIICEGFRCITQSVAVKAVPTSRGPMIIFKIPALARINPAQHIYIYMAYRSRHGKGSVP